MTTNKPYRTIELSVVLNQADREEQTKIINTNIVRWAGFFHFAPRYVKEGRRYCVIASMTFLGQREAI